VAPYQTSKGKEYRESNCLPSRAAACPRPRPRPAPSLALDKRLDSGKRRLGCLFKRRSETRCRRSTCGGG
jgi:hypothetical protein